jgi:hypothetical protein
MATASSRGKETRSAALSIVPLWKSFLFDWGFPLVLLSACALVVLLGVFGQIAPPTGVFTLGCLLLLGLGFFFFRSVLLDAAVDRKAVAWGFALIWFGITGIPLYFAVFVGQEITHGEVSLGGGGMQLSLGAQGAVYDVVLEGNFATTAGEAGREASYYVVLEKDGQKIQDFAGAFSERLSRQRLGRRGSTTTRQVHNHILHRLVSPGAGAYFLKVVSIDPQLTPRLTVTLYNDTYPEKTFWILSVMLLIGAYVGEVLYGDDVAPFVLVTASALAFVLIFRNLGVPPHSYRDLVGAVMLAAIIGPVGGWGFRVIADGLSRSLGFSRHKAAVATSGGRRKG